jgi:hypothetical protein
MRLNQFKFAFWTVRREWKVVGSDGPLSGSTSRKLQLTSSLFEITSIPASSLPTPPTQGNYTQISHYQ